jgi:hypothetical protein
MQHHARAQLLSTPLRSPLLTLRASTRRSPAAWAALRCRWPTSRCAHALLATAERPRLPVSSPEYAHHSLVCTTALAPTTHLHHLAPTTHPHAPPRQAALIDSLYGTERGLSARSEVRAEINELISQLEAKNPVPNPTEVRVRVAGVCVCGSSSCSRCVQCVVRVGGPRHQSSGCVAAWESLGGNSNTSFPENASFTA